MADLYKPRAKRIQDMETLVNRYPADKAVASVAPAENKETIWDTMKRAKSNLVDKPMEGLRIKQKSKARQWGKYRDEIRGILQQQ